MIKGKVVILLWRPWLGPFQLALAEELQNAGALLHLYVSSQAGAKSVAERAKPELFVRQSSFNVLYDTAASPVGSLQQEITRATANEAWLGVPYGHFAVADRHLGRGFALGGSKFPTSIPSRSSQAQMLAAFSAQIEFWKKEIDTYKPSLIIDGGKIVEAIASCLGVPYRVLAASRQGNLYYWAYNFYLESPEIQQRYLDLQLKGLPKAVTMEVEQATAVVSYWRTAMKTVKITNFIRRAGRMSARRVWYRLRGKRLDDVYDLGSSIAYLWRARHNARLMTSSRTVSLKDLEGRRFVYFPLATEPELTLQGLSPEYFFQLEAIAAMARDLPADVTLAIKEHHPACGARESSFYDRIWAFKNVVFLDMRERGLDVIRCADVTVTIAGSSGFEAATMGKPAIVLGRHNIYDFLPHVQIVTDQARMRTALHTALASSRPTPNARLDGSRYLEAVKDISFDLDRFDPFTPKSSVAQSSAKAAVQALLRSLTLPPASAGTVASTLRHSR